MYKNKDKLLARVTKNKVDGNQKIFFDLKDENDSNDVLKILRESGKIDVTNNTEFVDSMLGMLNFSFHKELKRKRYVYFKDGVKFEIDNYTQPAMKVAAIEGEKEKGYQFTCDFVGGETADINAEQFNQEQKTNK